MTWRGNLPIACVAEDGTDLKQWGKHMRRFGLVEGNSSKFWQIALDGRSFTVSWGRIGSAGQTQTKEMPSADKAQKEHHKMVAEKLKKGYREVGATSAEPATVAAPTASASTTPVPAAVLPLAAESAPSAMPALACAAQPAQLGFVVDCTWPHPKTHCHCGCR